MANRQSSPPERLNDPPTTLAPETPSEAATTELIHRADPIPANAIRHPACGQWWTGPSRAHCAACCCTFSTDSAADKHRIGKFGIDRRCADPASVGLVAREKPYGVLWGFPAPDGGYAALHSSTTDTEGAPA
ncbi:hypothetical protein ACFZB5_13785 [Streptomyces nodosus]|uniref:FDXHR family putative zinc-binding protein n=1 Tax=Streptomyces nodosus TaxID=40318 RepID=UPI0036E16EB5